MKSLLLYKIILLILLIKTTCIYSQKPWMSETPPGFLNDFFVGSGSSTFSEPEAEKIAYRDALKKINNSKGIIFEPSAEKMKYFSKQSNIDNLRKNERIIEIEDSSKFTSTSTIITDLKVWDKYSKYENGLFSVWVLVSIPKENPISPPSPFSPVWRSFLLPGWGQLYTDETFKGISFMVLSLGGLAGGFIFKQLSEDATNKAFSARTQTVRDFYNDESKNYDTYSKVSFITAAAIYIWNFIDAIAVKQDNLYVFMDKSDLGTKLCLNISF